MGDQCAGATLHSGSLCSQVHLLLPCTTGLLAGALALSATAALGAHASDCRRNAPSRPATLLFPAWRRCDDLERQLAAAKAGLAQEQVQAQQLRATLEQGEAFNLLMPACTHSDCLPLLYLCAYYACAAAHLTAAMSFCLLLGLQQCKPSRRPWRSRRSMHMRPTSSCGLQRALRRSVQRRLTR